MFKKYSKFLLPTLIISFILLFLFANTTLANGIVPDGGKKDSGNYSVGDFVVLLINVSNFVLSITGAVALLAFVAGGLMLLISSGSSNMVTRGKQTITGSTIGLIIIFSSWSIINFLVKAVGYEGEWYKVANIQNQQVTRTQSTSGSPSSGPSAPGSDTLNPDWSFRSGIADQVPDASQELIGLLNCMKSQLPSGVGVISSISDSDYIGDFSPCLDCSPSRPSTCDHSCTSCHYGGGESGNNKSYAVDFGDAGNFGAINSAATNCGGVYIENEGSHVHVSSSGCPGR